jgi:hypothetical protein
VSAPINWGQLVAPLTSVHTAPAAVPGVPPLSADQAAVYRNQFIQMILQQVVLALTNLLLPGAAAPQLTQFATNISTSFGGLGSLFGLSPTALLGTLNPVTIWTNVITTFINPLGLLAPLTGGLIPLVNIPGLPTSQITSGTFPMSIVNGLLGLFGGATTATQASNFFTNILSLFGTSGATMTGAPGSFNVNSVASNFINTILNPTGLLASLSSILNLFGGATTLTQGSNFFTNLLSMFNTPTLTGSPGAFNPSTALTSWINTLVNPLGLLAPLTGGLLSLVNIPGLPMSQTTGLLSGFTNLYPAATVNGDGTATPSPLSSSITLNGNGTATYVQDALTQLLNMADGTFSTAFNLIQNLGGVTGKLQGLSNQGSNIISTVTGALGGSGSGLADLTKALGAIPSNNVLGVAGISGMGSTMQGTWDQLYQAFSSATGSNQSLSSLANSAHGTANAASNSLTQTVSNASVLSGFIGARPANHGLDPTAVASYNLATNSNTALNATATVAPMSFHIVTQPTTFGNFETVAVKGGSGTFTGFFLNAYRMDATGNLAAVYNSADLKSQLNTAGGWVRTGSIPAVNQPSFAAGEVLAIETVQQGTGSVALRSQSTGVPNHPTALLQNFAASRNPTGNLTPGSIAAGSVVYSANQPWHSATVVAVPAGWQPPQTWDRSTAGTYTYMIPAFAKVVGAKLYLIVLGAGGGGQANYGAFIFFTGGNAGSWNTQTLVCGTDYPTTATSLTVVVGAAGAAAGAYWTNGHAGAASSAQWTDMSSVLQTLSGAGGTGGGNSGTSGSNGKAPSPNPEVYGGVSYFGGTAVGGNQNGSPPGGGGGGAGPYAVGNPGADGAVWIVASQT